MMTGRRAVLGLAALALAACAKSPPPAPEPAPQPVKPQASTRDEPVFYNGHHYRLRYVRDAASGRFDVRVSGSEKPLTAKDEASARDIASGTLRYFACPKDTTGRITGTPTYKNGTWHLSAVCGR